MFLLICEGKSILCVKGSYLMLKEVIKFFETILAGIMELAPVYVLVETEDLHQN